jgi:hypothetical protein
MPAGVSATSACTSDASSVERGIRPPFHRGTETPAAEGFARRTHAVSRKRRTTAGSEVHRPSPAALLEVCKRGRAPNLLVEFLLAETTAAGNRDNMLRQDIDRTSQRTAWLGGPVAGRLPCRRTLH